MRNYHHGDLAAALLAEAARTIARGGPGALNLRSLAKQLGVSHNAFRHHFGSRQGLLNALAIQGHRQLLTALQEGGQAAADPHLGAGINYVRFALAHPGHFAVMFRPDLLDLSDPALNEARFATFAVLGEGAGLLRGTDVSRQEAAVDMIASWAMVHGLANLALTGNLEATGLLDDVAGGNMEEVTRLAAGRLGFAKSKEE